MKKGFTLVELLTIITLIAVLGLITVPIITASVKKAEKKAFKETINNIIESTKIYNAENNYEGITKKGIYLKDGIIEFENSDKIISGQISYDNGIYYLNNIGTDKYCANGSSKDINISNGKC